MTFCFALYKILLSGNDAVGSFFRSFLNPDWIRPVMLVFGLIDGYWGLILVFAAMQLPLQMLPLGLFRAFLRVQQIDYGFLSALAILYMLPAVIAFG